LWLRLREPPKSRKMSITKEMSARNFENT